MSSPCDKPGNLKNSSARVAGLEHLARDRTHEKISCGPMGILHFRPLRLLAQERQLIIAASAEQVMIDAVQLR